MRKSNWQTLLSNYILEARGAPFKWGEHDCCMFPCNCIQAIIGVDPAVYFRGKYKTKAQAYKILKEFAGGGLIETVEKITQDMKFPEVGINYAQRGDVVICDQEGGDTLGIISMSGKDIMVASEDGVCFQPLSVGKRAWRVE